MNRNSILIDLSNKTGNQASNQGLCFLVAFDFHGDNGGSNPPGDAKYFHRINELHLLFVTHFFRSVRRLIEAIARFRIPVETPIILSSCGTE